MHRHAAGVFLCSAAAGLVEVLLCLARSSHKRQARPGPHLLPVACICCQFARQVVLPFPFTGCDASPGLKTLTELIRLYIAEQDGALWRGCLQHKDDNSSREGRT